MYSPKIQENLITVLHKLARQEQKSMAELVDEMLRTEIGKRNGREHSSNGETVSKEVKKNN